MARALKLFFFLQQLVVCWFIFPEILGHYCCLSIGRWQSYRMCVYVQFIHIHVIWCVCVGMIVSVSIERVPVLDLCSDFDLCNWFFCMEHLYVELRFRCTANDHRWIIWVVGRYLQKKKKNKSFHITQKPNRNPLDRISMLSSALENWDSSFGFAFGVYHTLVFGSQTAPYYRPYCRINKYR